MALKKNILCAKKKKKGQYDIMESPVMIKTGIVETLCINTSLPTWTQPVFMKQLSNQAADPAVRWAAGVRVGSFSCCPGYPLNFKS
jgi:hypothetical protein